MHRLVFLALTWVLVAVGSSGCGRKEPAHGHDHPPSDAPEHGGHAHVAPHGGTIVVLGDEAFHLEFVRDAAAGKLIAYVLDGEMEGFVRVPAAEFTVVALVNGKPETVVFRAVANRVTGETVGDTAQFEAQAEWLKTTESFEATLTSLAVRGAAFEAVAFKFAKGQERH